MNSATLAQANYSKARAPVGTPREAEYQAFAKITYQITRANTGEIENFPALVAAIHQNRRLWNILALDAADDASPLPPILRARILYLAGFTEQHSRKILRRQADAAALININTIVMRGLQGQSGTGS